MAMMMLTIELEPSEASLRAVRRKLQLEDYQIDANFGVVRLSPDGNQYAIMVDEDVVSRVTRKKGVKGPFANPRIEPFGPPK